MNFPEFSEIGAVGIHHGGRVVVNTLNLHFVNRNYHYHLIFFGIFGQPFDRRSRNFFGGAVPLDVLFGTEIRSVKDLLQAENLNSFFTGRFNQRQVFLDHSLFYFGGSTVVSGICGLDVGTFNNSGHKSPLNIISLRINHFENLTHLYCQLKMASSFL